MNRATPDEIRQRFTALQARLKSLFQRLKDDTRAPRTVVVVPSLSLDSEVLATIGAARHYEERMLSMLMLLRMPRTRVVFVTSTPLAPSIVDYYLHLLSGVPTAHARSRLTLLSANDASPRRLTTKLLERPRLMGRIRAAIGDPACAHLSVFTATYLERDLALALDIPLYGCDPELSHWGTKSGSRTAFRRAGVLIPEGRENLRDLSDVAEALAELRRRSPLLHRAVVKLEEGFSGEGNAVFDFRNAPDGPALTAWVRDHLRERLRFESTSMSFETYAAKFQELGGIVESWIEGAHKRTPSVQMRVNALGELETISSHEQVMGGPTGQIFLGSRFPADATYRRPIQDESRKIGAILQLEGVLGRFSIDWVSVPTNQGWRHYAIEINLRKGGTTLPYQMLQFLTDGRIDDETGAFRTPLGQERCYRATDNLVDERLRRLIPEDLMDILVERNLHFAETTQKGVVFSLISALSEHGKLGLVAIAETPEGADALFDKTIEVLLEEAEAT
jgi:PGM1 C-terminal domain